MSLRSTADQRLATIIIFVDSIGHGSCADHIVIGLDRQTGDHLAHREEANE